MGNSTRTEETNGVTMYEYNISRNISASAIAWNNNTNVDNPAYWQMSNVYVSFTVWVASLPSGFEDYAEALGFTYSGGSYYYTVTNAQYTGYQQCTGGNGMRYAPDSSGYVDNVKDNTARSSRNLGLDLYLSADILGNIITDGKLIIEKLLIDEDGNTVTDTETEFTFQVKDENGDYVYFTSEGKYTTDTSAGSYNFTLKGGQTFTLSGLPEGEYTVIEVQDQNDGYTIYNIVIDENSATDRVVTDSAAVVEINANQSVILVDFTNEKMDTTGSAGFRKVSYGLTDASIYPDPDVVVYKLDSADDTTVTDADRIWSQTMEANDSSVLDSAADNNGTVYVVNDLDAGWYFISESDFELETYSVNSWAVSAHPDTEDEDGDGNTTEISTTSRLTEATVSGMDGWVFYVTAGESVWVGLHNSYERQMVTVWVEKVFTGIDAMLVPANFAIDIYDGTTLVATLTLDNASNADDSEGDYYAWYVDLPVLAGGRQYTFTERGAGVRNYDYTVTINGEPSATGSANIVPDPSASTPPVAFENNYEKTVGDLVITKDFFCNAHTHSFQDGTDALAELKEHFSVLVTNSAGTVVADLTIADANGSNGSYTWTLTDLPLDTYTVTESGYGLDHHTVAIEVSVDGGTVTTSPSATAAVDADGTTVEIKNTYNESARHIVRIPVSKTVKQLGDVAPVGETFLFDVNVTWKSSATADPSSLYLLVAETAAVAATPNAGADYSFTLTTTGGKAEETVSGYLAISGTEQDFENIESITITEVSSGKVYWTYDSADWTVTFDTSSGTAVAVLENNASVAAFTNGYDEDLLSIEVPVYKQIAVWGNVSPAGDQTFDFLLDTADFDSLSSYFSVKADGTDITDTGVFSITANEKSNGVSHAEIIITGTAADLAGLVLSFKEDTTTVPADWTYDASQWTVTLAINDKGEVITKEYGWSGGVPEGEVTFENIYDKVRVEIPVEKLVVVGGGSITDPEGERTYTFSLNTMGRSGLGNIAVSYTGDFAAIEGGFSAVIDGKGTADGTIVLEGTAADFAALGYLSIRETGTPSESWDYDDTGWLVSINTTTWKPEIHMATGEGVSDATYDEASFVNTFVDKLYTVSFDVDKVAVSDTYLGETEFGFTLDMAFAAGTDLTEGFAITYGEPAVTYPQKNGQFFVPVEVENGIAVVSTVVTITGTLSDLRSIKGIGLSEIIPADLADGWVYDDAAYSVTLSYDPVTDVWTANVPENGVSFENTYELPRGNLIITKDFDCLTHEHSFSDEDSAIAELEEYFTVNVYDSTNNTVAILTIADADVGSGSGHYTWTLKDLPLGTYTVTETGYGLNHHTVAIEMNGVAVTDPTVAAVIAKNSDGKVEITNTYEQSARHIVRIPVSKTVKQLGDVAPAGETFLFDVVVDWVDDSIDHSGVWRLVAEAAALEATASKDADYSFTLTTTGGTAEETVSGYLAISGTEEDFENIASITITEVKSGKTYWTYDGTAWKFVTGKDADGHPTLLHTDGTAVSRTAPAAFANNYDEDLLQITIPVVKTVSGDPLLEDKTFTFVLTGYDPDALSPYFTVKTGSTDIAADGQFAVTIPAGEVKKDAAVVITGTEADLRAITNWALSIYEVTGDDSTWTYDETVWEVNIAVADETIKLRKQGRPLENLVSSYNAVAFENIYDEPVYEVMIPVMKIVTSDTALGAETFDFALDITYTAGTTRTGDYAIDFGQDAVVYDGIADQFSLSADVVVGADQASTAITITGTMADLETIESIELSEIIPAALADGWDYDTAVYEVALSYSADDAAWEALMTDGAAAQDSAVFENKYTLPRGELKITKDFNIYDINKELLSEENTGELLKAIEDTYTIRLWARDGESYTEAAELTLKDGTYANGIWSWTVKDLPFGEYTVSESGLMFEHYALIRDDAGENITGVSISYNNETLPVIQYNNTYAFGGDFTFTKADANKTASLVNEYIEDNSRHTVDLPISKTVVVDGDVIPEGDLFFGLEVTLNWVDDPASQDVTVTYDGAVNDLGSGAYILVPASVTYTEVNGVLTATVVGGIELTGTKAGFENLTSLTIREKMSSAAANWIYDGTVWTAIGDATVEPFIYKLYTGEGDAMTEVAGADTVALTNRYDEDLVTVEIPVTKNVTGDPIPADKQFHFILGANVQDMSDYFNVEYSGKNVTDGATHGNTGFFLTVPAGTTTGTATVTVTGKAADLEALELTIKESAGTDSNIVYDTTEWTATFALENGEYVTSLTADPVSDAEAITFTNEYDEPVYEVIVPIVKCMSEDSDPLPENKKFKFSVTTEVTELSGDFRLGYRGEYLELDAQDKNVFYLTVPVGEVQTRAVIVIKGTAADFEALEFIIAEENTGDDTVTYDKRAWKVSVEANDGGYASVITKKAAPLQNLLNNHIEVAFENTYDEPVHEVSFPVKKTVSGDPLPEEKTFHFIFGADDVSSLSADFGYSYTGENVVDGADFGNTGAFLTIPAGETEGEFTMTIKGTAADLEAFFPVVVKESDSGDATIAYDETEYTVKLTLDDATGEYGVKISSGILGLVTSDAASFVNEYDEPVYTMTIPVTKMLTGESVGKKTEFTFHVTTYWQVFDGMSAADLSPDFTIEFLGENVKSAGENAFTLTIPAGVKTVEASVVITGTAKDFTEVLYGLYISEDTSDVPKYWTYDQGMWWITPAEENTDGIWNVVITDPDKETAEGVIFVNEYDPPDEPGAPKTGDDNYLALWGLMMAVSAAALSVVLTMSKKRRRDG